MFEPGLREASDAEVVAAITERAAAEAVAAAARLAAVAEFARRRCSEDNRADWAFDGWDGAAAEVSAALGVSHGRAAGQMRLGLALARRLPAVAGLFAEGVLGYRMVAAIAWRTDLVTDPEALTAIDSALADVAKAWGPLSDYKLEQVIDAVIDAVDPGALRRTRANVRGRQVQIGGRDEESGTAPVWGRLLAADAKVLKKRLTTMARGVCKTDPRTMPQRRADALGALAAGAQHLRCQCGSPDCPAPAGGDGGSTAVIHVLTDAPAVTAAPAPKTDPNLSGRPQCVPFRRDMTLQNWLAAQPGEPDPVCPPATAVILGGPVLPTPLLAELIAGGARVRPVGRPGREPEPGYRPSAALAEFVRLRDQTCRFPNCDVSAEFCDIDHSVPWPAGPTHASNLHCKCRRHHLLKTFWTGPGGWSEQQFPDATIEWTSPTGQVYTTLPGCRLLFPNWDTATAELPTAATLSGAQDAESQNPEDRGLRMPRRRRTRIVENACRIRRERALNDAHVAERCKPPPL